LVSSKIRRTATARNSRSKPNFNSSSRKIQTTTTILSKIAKADFEANSRRTRPFIEQIGSHSSRKHLEKLEDERFEQLAHEL
jgi:hypothetical protein